MAGYHGRFTWYELITTDMAAASAFYSQVVGWSAQDESKSDLAYTVFCSGTTPVSGLMDLPQEARRMGATPRWMGYISVDDCGRRGRPAHGISAGACTFRRPAVISAVFRSSLIRKTPPWRWSMV